MPYIYYAYTIQTHPLDQKKEKEKHTQEMNDTANTLQIPTMFHQLAPPTPPTPIDKHSNTLQYKVG